MYVRSFAACQLVVNQTFAGLSVRLHVDFPPRCAVAHVLSLCNLWTTLGGEVSTAADACAFTVGKTVPAGDELPASQSGDDGDKSAQALAGTRESHRFDMEGSTCWHTGDPRVWGKQPSAQILPEMAATRIISDTETSGDWAGAPASPARRTRAC